jgi:hypothetical protein
MLQACERCGEDDQRRGAIESPPDSGMEPVLAELAEPGGANESGGASDSTSTD